MVKSLDALGRVKSVRRPQSWATPQYRDSALSNTAQHFPISPSCSGCTSTVCSARVLVAAIASGGLGGGILGRIVEIEENFLTLWVLVTPIEQKGSLDVACKARKIRCAQRNPGG